MKPEHDASKNRVKASGDQAAKQTPQEFTFEELAQGGNEVVIHFADQQYRLRLTKNNKLILNK